MNLVLRIVDDEKHATILSGRSSMIAVGTAGRIIARDQCVVFKDQITLQDITVFQARVMVRGIACTRRHPH